MMNSLKNKNLNLFIQLLFGAICVLLMGSIGYYVYNEFELVTVEIDEGYSEEARRNPYLAADRWLDRAGVQANTLKGLSKIDDLPNTEDTLIIFSSRMVLSKRRNKELRTWIENGGHLITTAQATYNNETNSSADRFLDEFGLQRYRSEYLNRQVEKQEVREYDTKSADDNDTVKNEESNVQNIRENANVDQEDNLSENDIKSIFYSLGIDEKLETCSTKLKQALGSECDKEVLNSLTQITFGLENDPVNVYLDTQHHLYDHTETAAAHAGSNIGTHLIQYHHGKGLLTIVTDSTLWQNAKISLFDHAYLLWLLTGESQNVWILYDVDIDHWAILLGKNAPEFILSFVILLLLWVSYRSYRFGPIISTHRSERRELMEHIEASAQFCWQYNLREQLASTLRNEILLLAGNRHPGFSHLSPGDQDALLCQWLNTDIQSIKSLMRTATPYKETEFTSFCQHLQALRNRL